MDQLETLPQYLQSTARRLANRRVAMRKKQFGIWREVSWAESWQHVKHLALGLMRLGVQRGDKVCIIGDNDPEYFWAQLAIQAAGGIAAGIFTDSTPSELQYIVHHSDSVVVFAKDQEQCDKLLEIRAQLPNVRKLIYWDEKGLWNVGDPWLQSFQATEQLGRELEAHEPACFEARLAQGKGDDLAIFCYTSGTTGLPKGAMISHSNLIAGCLMYDQVDKRRASDEYLSFLPPAWITENILGLTVHVVYGMIINFPEEPETVQENLREIAPHALLFSSRIWEGLVSTVQVKITETSAINRLLYRMFMPVGYRVADLRFGKGHVPPWWRVLNVLGEVAVFAALRDKLGLSRVRSAYSAGAALSPDVVRFFRAIGVNIKNLFGSTEAQIHTLHVGDDVKFETVGVAPPGIEIRIAEDGEILVKGPSVFSGYYKNPEATAKALKDGWFHTGDAGYLREDKHLIYLDRVKDLLELATGDKFSPQYIEGRLKFSPYVKDVMAIGGQQRPYVTAIVNIDFANVGRWAEKKRIAFTTFVDLAQKPEVYDLIRQDVVRVNQTLPPPARVRKFVLLHKEFDPDDAELTRTRKLRRNVVEDRYREMIETMYADGTEVRVRAAVKYRDGRAGIIETAVRVCALEE
ncbi:MAG: AMP-binding protein [Chloroflexi bacterium]|nr:AMP-binding protein [Chloroflexota bacterium]